MSVWAKERFAHLPDFIRKQFFCRDDSNELAVSQIETEKLLAYLVTERLKSLKKEGKYKGTVILIKAPSPQCATSSDTRADARCRPDSTATWPSPTAESHASSSKIHSLATAPPREGWSKRPKTGSRLPFPSRTSSNSRKRVRTFLFRQVRHQQAYRRVGQRQPQIREFPRLRGRPWRLVANRPLLQPGPDPILRRDEELHPFHRFPLRELRLQDHRRHRAQADDPPLAEQVRRRPLEAAADPQQPDPPALKPGPFVATPVVIFTAG